MGKKKSVSEKISDAIQLIKDGKTTKALTMLEKVHQKMSEKEDKSTKVKRKPNAYNNFVKENFQKISASNPKMLNTDIMSKIAKMWGEKKGEVKK